MIYKKITIVILLATAGILLLFVVKKKAKTGDIELGRRIFEEGILASGQTLKAKENSLEGKMLSCANCHRKSGYGTSEGATLVPPITAPFLFEEKQPDREELFRNLFQELQPNPVWAQVRATQTRPAYTDQQLVLAIQKGISSDGHIFDPLMPRYDLNETDQAHLLAYLKTLGKKNAPGVTDKKIHFATIVTEDVATDRKDAFLAVIDAYFERKNRDTKGQLHHLERSPWYKEGFFDTFREWEWHLWELNGPPESWAQQLDAYYRKQPVFALVSGLSDKDWAIIHQFAEQKELPSIFPNTPIPVVEQGSNYSLYLSKGIAGEAEALVHFWKTQGHLNEQRPIIQIYKEVEMGNVAAQVVRRELEAAGYKSLRDIPISSKSSFSNGFWRNQVKENTAFVIWLNEKDLSNLNLQEAFSLNNPSFYFSYPLLDDPAILFNKMGFVPSRTFFTYPFALPDAEIPRIYRVRSWMRSREIPLTHESLQLNTFLALSVTDYALMHMVNHFSRNYLIERIEHEVENTLNPGVFPHLSLGPGQRFASKGCYMVRFDTKGGIFPISGWIIP